MGGRLLLALGAGLAGGLWTACGTASVAPDPYPEAPHVEALGPEDLRALESGLAALGDGRAESAVAILEGLARLHPASVPLGICLQEAELARAGEVEAAPGSELPEDHLRRAYRQRAEREPGVASLVLAARLEGDPVSALLLLDRALELDPRSAWAHYGRANVLARRGELEEARRALDAALATDPGHLSARRLSAWMLARLGRVDEARRELEAWLDRSQLDPFVLPAARAAARLDLALLLLHDGRAAEALRRLAELGDEAGESRRFSAMAVALEARDDHLGALVAARRAAAADPQALLPAVQEALILENRLGDPAGALEAWRRVIALAGLREDLGALLQRSRAQVHVERLERAAAPASSASPADPLRP